MPSEDHTLYLLHEPTTGLHPADVELLIAQLHHLVDAGGQIIATGTPAELVATPASRTGPYLAGRLP